MKVQIQTGTQMIDMERSDVPEIGTFCFQADSAIAFQVTAVQRQEDIGGYFVSTEHVPRDRDLLESRGRAYQDGLRMRECEQRLLEEQGLPLPGSTESHSSKKQHHDPSKNQQCPSAIDC